MSDKIMNYFLVVATSAILVGVIYLIVLLPVVVSEIYK